MDGLFEQMPAHGVIAAMYCLYHIHFRRSEGAVEASVERFFDEQPPSLPWREHCSEISGRRARKSKSKRQKERSSGLKSADEQGGAAQRNREQTTRLH